MAASTPLFCTCPWLPPHSPHLFTPHAVSWTFCCWVHRPESPLPQGLGCVRPWPSLWRQTPLLPVPWPVGPRHAPAPTSGPWPSPGSRPQGWLSREAGCVLGGNCPCTWHSRHSELPRHDRCSPQHVSTLGLFPVRVPGGSVSGPRPDAGTPRPQARQGVLGRELPLLKEPATKGRGGEGTCTACLMLSMWTWLRETVQQQPWGAARWTPGRAQGCVHPCLGQSGLPGSQEVQGQAWALSG